MGTQTSLAAPDVITGPAVALLTASGIEKSYRRGMWPARRRRPVLRGVDLALYPGEVVGLVGENGSGKSTQPPLRGPHVISAVRQLHQQLIQFQPRYVRKP